MTVISDFPIDYNEWCNNVYGRKPSGRFIKKWTMLYCPVCCNVTLLYESEIYLLPVGNMKNRSILYPQVSIDGDVPTLINTAFDSALKVRSDGAICCLALRRTLEMICKNNGETSGTLEKKLLRLSEKGIIPPILDEMAKLLRQIGNDAAHGNDKSFSVTIVNILIDFTRTIIEYVYVLPQKLRKIQKQIDQEEIQES